MSYEAAPGQRSTVERAQRIADDVLFPRAQDVDRGRLPLADGLRALASAGLFGVAGPTSHGGVDLGSHALRRTIAAVASGCGATFFVWVQHHGVVRSVCASPNTELVERFLRPMCAGDVVAGVAFAHVRRTGRPAILATPLTDGAWQLDGFAPWATSWGIADRFAIAAESADGRLVWAMISGTEAPGVTASELELSVLSATGTVELRFERCIARADDIVLAEDVGQWRARDRQRAALGQPAALGVADRAIRLLDAANGDEAADAAGRLGGELAATWEHDDDLVEAMVSGADDIRIASDHRAACLDLARRSTAALLAATGGRGMDLDHPAQRLAREADFYVIQAQTVDGRAATLRSL